MRLSYTPIGENDWKSGWIIEEDTKRHVCKISDTRRGDEEIDRLGRLLAAAPQMYEAIRAAIEDAHGVLDEDAARAVLAEVGHRPRAGVKA